MSNENHNALERIWALLPLSSKDETRSHLMGVAISNRGDEVLLEVTDGHRMVIEYIDCPELHAIVATFELNVVQKLMINRCSHAALKEAIRESKNHCALTLQKDMKSIVVNRRFAINYEITERYPKLAKLMPEHKNPKRIAFNAEYLIDIAKALNSDPKKRTVEVEFDAADPLKPFIIHGLNGRKAVLMPCRLNK